MARSPLRDWRQRVVLNDAGCLVWQGAPNSDGYGHWWMGGKNLKAHRAVYELEVGPIPPGLQIDHLCRNRMCVNPDHLEAVTQRVNLLRGVGWGAQNAAKTHCDNGHEFTPENTMWRRSGARDCRECHRAQGRRASRRYYAKRRGVQA